MDPVNRIAGLFNTDGSVKVAGPVKQSEAMPVNLADVLAERANVATSNVNAQREEENITELHQAVSVIPAVFVKEFQAALQA